jgi:cytochrome P450
MITSSSTQATGSDIFDPMTPSNLQEPFVFFAKLRKENPVYWNEQYSFWMLTRYQDVKAVLRAPRQFSSATGVEIEKRAEQIPQSARAGAANPAAETRAQERFNFDLIARRDGNRAAARR